MIMTAYKVGANWNPQRIINTGVDVSTPVTSVTRDVGGVSGTSAVYISPPPPPSGCIWKVSIGNIRKTTNQKFNKSSELNAPIDITLANDST